MEESGNPAGVLDAFVQLHATGDIDGIGAQATNGITDIRDIQAARQYQRPGKVLWHQIPVERLAGATHETGIKGIE
jgi:hypothetical protein